MARPPKPWYRTYTKSWCVQLKGKKIDLGKTEEEAYKKFNELMNISKEPKFILDKEFQRIKKNAEKRNIKFYISIYDIENQYEKQNKTCALSGEELFFNQRITKGNASVDRIDSNKDYTINNIQIVHKDINSAKFTKSNIDFITLCKKVAKYNA